jgi:hypothetical protein
MSDTVINGDWLTRIKNVVSVFCNKNPKILNQISVVENNLNEYKKARKVCSNYFSTKDQEKRLGQSISELAVLMQVIDRE